MLKMKPEESKNTSKMLKKGDNLISLIARVDVEYSRYKLFTSEENIIEIQADLIGSGTTLNNENITPVKFSLNKNIGAFLVGVHENGNSDLYVIDKTFNLNIKKIDKIKVSKNFIEIFNIYSNPWNELIWLFEPQKPWFFNIKKYLNKILGR